MMHKSWCRKNRERFFNLGRVHASSRHLARAVCRVIATADPSITYRVLAKLSKTNECLFWEIVEKALEIDKNTLKGVIRLKYKLSKSWLSIPVPLRPFLSNDERKFYENQI